MPQRNQNKSCSAATPKSYQAGTPLGPVNLPTLGQGQHVGFAYGGADAAFGFGLGVSGGVYTYRNSNGVTVAGFYVSPALAVGAGASVSAQTGVSANLGSFFGNSGAVGASVGVGGGTVYGNESGVGASGGFSGGAKVMAESSYAIPVGSPWVVSCH